MRYRKLSPDNDYTFGGSELEFYNNVPAAVGQAVETRILLWLGEWFLNLEEGTPYLEGILGKHSQDTANLVIQDRILNTQGVVNISDYVSNLDENLRFLSVVATINTIYGQTTVQIENSANF